MLEPVLVRPVPRLAPTLVVAVFAAVAIFGAVIVKMSTSHLEPSVQATYSQALGAELIGLRTDAYRGPDVVLACLARGAFCDERWVSYAAIDAVADLSRLDPYGACLPGCLFVSRDGGDWTCERHVFYLSLASLAW